MFKKRIDKLRKSFLKRFLFLIRKQQFEFVYKQIKFQLDLRDSIDREIFFNGYYEENQIQFLIDRIKKYNIKHFIDVGANIGIYSLRIGKKFPQIKINSIEPHPSAFKRLRANIELNKLSDTIKTHNIALSDVTGPGFLSSAFDTQSGGAKVEQTDHNRFNISKIKLARAEDILNLKNERVAIKIDVEGDELNVLLGAKKLINKFNPIIVLEFNSCHIFSRTFLRDILNVLKYYKVYRILPRGKIISLGDKYNPSEYEIFSYQNLLFLPRKERGEILKILN